jgi:AcrR family transcriptional regulator
MAPSEIHRRRLHADERRKQILENAFRLISEQGFKTVSTRDIAKAAQINEALIYKYFPTKDALLRAIIIDTIEKQPVRLALPETRDDFRASLQVFVDYYLEKNDPDGAMVRIILYAAMEDFPLPYEFDLKNEGTFFHWFARSIEQGRQKWGFNPQADPVISLSLFMGGLLYFVLLHSISVKHSVSNMFAGADVAQFKYTFVDTFLKSLDS